MNGQPSVQRHERYLARQHLAEDYLALAVR